jgi:hypothetical protein
MHFLKLAELVVKLVLPWVVLTAADGVSFAQYPWLADQANSRPSIPDRVAPPSGYTRVPVQEGSFGEWLRGLPLKPPGWQVHLFNGGLKKNQSAHIEVVDLDVIQFQECADSIIRLRAEFLWVKGAQGRICFKFTNGEMSYWNRWQAGWRPLIKGGRVEWEKTAAEDNSRKSFREYLRKVFEFAGTLSLQKELMPVSVRDLEVGDVIVEGGSPGHAVLIVDAAENPNKGRLYLLGQGFMPAQEFSILVNPGCSATSPWYEVSSSGNIHTPEWNFKRPFFGRFRE